MSNKHHFLISYIIDNQPMTIDVKHDSDELSRGQALGYIRQQHQDSTSASITDIQIASRHGSTPEPGHNLQP